MSTRARHRFVDGKSPMRRADSSCPFKHSARSSASSSARNYGNYSNRTDFSSITHFSNLPHLEHSTIFSGNSLVYAKPPFGGAEHVLNYLARCTHRVIISNHRLVAFNNDRVSFRWRDYAHGGKQKL
jgi:hypothetical protein